MMNMSADSLSTSCSEDIYTFATIEEYDLKCNDDRVDFEDDNFCELECEKSPSKIPEETIYELDINPDGEKIFNEFTKNEYDPNTNYNLANTELDMEQVLGLDACKRLLVNMIGKPLACKKHYENMNGDMDDQLCVSKRFACLYGMKGTGKCTLMKAFCRRYAVRLVIIDGKVCKDSMMSATLSYAKENQPCVIYFDGCDHFFKDCPAGNAGKEFIYYYDKYKMRSNPVWTVISSQSVPAEFFPGFRILIGNNYTTAAPLDPHQRMILFYRILKSRYNAVKSPNGGFSNVKAFYELLRTLVEASHNCPGSIIQEYCAEVFRLRKDNMSLTELRDCTPRSTRVLPRIDDFMENIRSLPDGRRRICDADCEAIQRRYSDWQARAQPNLHTKKKSTGDSHKKRRNEISGSSGSSNSDSASSSNKRRKIKNEIINSKFFQSTNSKN